MPFFSVIIPTYNRAAQIIDAIDSVLNQTYADFELIIVDDGSEDSTAEIVLAIKDPRTKYFLINNSGVSAARNYGADKASGQYLIFLDSDDLFFSNCLNSNYKTIVQNDYPEFIFSDVEAYKKNRNKEIISARDPYKDGKSIGVYLTGAYAIKRDFFLRIGGFDSNLKFGENAELKIRIEQNSFTFACTDRVAVIYNYSADGGSKNLENRVEAIEYTIQKHIEYFNKNKKTLKLFLQSNAIILIRLSRFSEAKKTVRRAFKAYPYDIKLFARLILIHFPLLAIKVWKKVD